LSVESNGDLTMDETLPLITVAPWLERRGSSWGKTNTCLASVGACLALCFLASCYTVVSTGDLHKENKLRALQGNQALISSQEAVARVILVNACEGMGTFPTTLAQFLNLTSSSGQIGVMPCAKDGRVVSCTENVSDPLPLSEYYEMSGWNLDAFSPAKGDLHPEMVFCMKSLGSGFGCDELALPGPRSLSAWRQATANATHVGILSLRKNFLEALHVAPIYFNFSSAREAEVADILEQNELAPALPGKGITGNYVVYHWRSEALSQINYSFCAERLVQHAHAHAPNLQKVLVSDLPFNTSALPTLWDTNAAKRIGANPGVIAARNVLSDAGFTKVEFIAPAAGYDLRYRDLGHVSIWDTIIARGGSTLAVCTDPACEPCYRRTSSFGKQLVQHYIMHHGDAAVVHTSWM